MTLLESFVNFAKALPTDRREALEEVLADLMAAHSSDAEFTSEELAELDRRFAEERPEFAAPYEIEAIFGKPFRR